MPVPPGFHPKNGRPIRNRLKELNRLARLVKAKVEEKH